MVSGRFKIHTHKNTSMTWGEEVAPLVKDLSCNHEDMHSILRMHTVGRGLGVVAHNSNPSTGEGGKLIPGTH